MTRAMQDKTVLITGASSGIGYETALALSAMGAATLLVGRDRSQTEAAANRIRAQTGSTSVEVFTADLSSLREIRSLAETTAMRHRRIDVLINNAGTWISKFMRTEDGIETVLAVKHMAPFLLTHLLLPQLRNSGAGRVITVSSDSHFHGAMHIDDRNLKAHYHGLRAYAQSKLANVLFTRHRDAGLKTAGIPVTAYAVQPGLVKTHIGTKHTISLHALVWRLRRLWTWSLAACGLKDYFDGLSGASIHPPADPSTRRPSSMPDMATRATSSGTIPMRLLRHPCEW